MIRKRIATVLVALFVFFGTIGVALSMSPDHHGKMTNCPFMDHMETVCPMTLPQHLSAWQIMFRAAPAQNIMALFFLIFSASLFFIFIHPPQNLSLRIFHRDKNTLHAYSPSKILRLIE